MKQKLEDGSQGLADKLILSFPGEVSLNLARGLPVICSIAISLRKLAEEANRATSNMNVGQMK